MLMRNAVYLELRGADSCIVGLLTMRDCEDVCAGKSESA